MCKSIHFSIYITNPYVFFSLLATTGAASTAQYRLFSFAFFETCYCFIQANKFATVKWRVWRSMCKSNHFSIYIFKSVFSHYRRRREPPVSLICGEFRSSFGKSNIYFRKREHLQRSNNGFGDPYVNQYTLSDLHKEATCFSPTIGDDRSRQVPSVTATFHWVFS